MRKTSVPAAWHGRGVTFERRVSLRLPRSLEKRRAKPLEKRKKQDINIVKEPVLSAAAYQYRAAESGR